MVQTQGEEVPTLLDDEVDIVLYVHTDIFGAKFGQSRLHSSNTSEAVRHALLC